jgi:hypothetical protein
MLAWLHHHPLCSVGLIHGGMMIARAGAAAEEEAAAAEQFYRPDQLRPTQSTQGKALQ